MPEAQTATIRPLLSADAAAFQRLRLHALLDCPGAFTSSHKEEVQVSIEEIANRLAPRSDKAVFGAFEGERLIGMAGLGREAMKKIAHRAYVWGMYVEAAHRGQGLGRRLLQAAIDFADRVPDIRQVCISVYSDNSLARSLYISTGFVPFGIEPAAMRVDGRSFDEEHMVRFLVRR